MRPAASSISVPRRSAASVALLLLSALLPVLLSGCAGTGGTSVSGPDRAELVAGSLFVASLPWDQNNVDLVEVRTGHVVQRLLPDKQGRLDVTGLFRARSQLLVTYATGPECTSGVAGCGPKPYTCGGEVDRVTLATGAVEVLWRVDKDTRLAAASPNPAGTQIAALASPCVPSQVNGHLVVRSLGSGVTWSIGAGLPRCHSITGPVWTADGRSLLTSYATAPGTAPYEGPDGTCSSLGDASLVQLSAEHPQDGLNGTVVAPRPGCTYQTVAAAGTTAWALQSCGSQTDRIDGPLTLLRLDAQLRTTQSWALGSCDDGDAALSARPDGRVLVEAYRYCADGAAPPVSILATLTGTTLTPSTPVAGGEAAYRYPTW